MQQIQDTACWANPTQLSTSEQQLLRTCSCKVAALLKRGGGLWSLAEHMPYCPEYAATLINAAWCSTGCADGRCMPALQKRLNSRAILAGYQSQATKTAGLNAASTLDAAGDFQHCYTLNAQSLAVLDASAVSGLADTGHQQAWRCSMN